MVSLGSVNSMYGANDGPADEEARDEELANRRRWSLVR